MKKSVKDFIDGFRSFYLNLNSLVNTILLLFTYFIGIGLPSLAGKAFGKMFLDSRKATKSYWRDFQKYEKKKEDYYRMY